MSSGRWRFGLVQLVAQAQQLLVEGAQLRLRPPGRTQDRLGDRPRLLLQRLSLFAAGYAACFLSAIKYVARNQKVAVSDGSTITASVGVGPRDDGKGFGLDVALQVSLPGLERAQAEALVEQAHIVCPYSHATRGNISVALSVV